MLKNTIRIAARAARALHRASRPIEGIADAVSGKRPGRARRANRRAMPSLSLGAGFPAIVPGASRAARQATALTLALLVLSFAAGVGAYLLTMGDDVILASVSAVEVDEPGTREQVQRLWRSEARQRAEAWAADASMLQPADERPLAAYLGQAVPPLEGDPRAAEAAVTSASGVGQEPRELQVVVPLPTPTPAPAVAAPPAELSGGQRVQATVSFYYCEHEPGVSAGDGGGFCGVMRNGSVVHSGAAACDYAYFGQRFRIVGDPTGRVYSCADTGSAVHGLHRDIWFATSTEGWAWLEQVGRNVTLEILP